MADNHIRNYSQKYTREVYNICRPLQSLQITYFAHVHIDKEGRFSALSNNPEFIEHYLSHKYYNCDIHMAEQAQLSSYILWDDMELTGESLKLHLDSFAFGVQHTFTIVEIDENGSNYYHFANNQTSRHINQIYLNNLDLLKLFIKEFNQMVKRTPSLSQFYDVKFHLELNTGGYSIQDDDALKCPEKRSFFLKELKKELSGNMESIILPQQQMRCLHLLSRGMTSKEIARELKISPRTVEQHILKARESMGCRNSKEMIVQYKELITFQEFDK